MDIKQDALAAIGNTPLIRLRRASEATGCEILGKAEFMNPGQSVKDRAALWIVRDAIARGRLKPGGVIKEDEIELSEFFRDTLVLNKPVDDWRKALVQRGCERNLFPQIRSRKSAGWI